MWFPICIPLSSILLMVSCMELEKVVVKRAEFGDQAMSGSGYSFQAHSGQPVSYQSYTIGDNRLNNFGYPPVTLGKYSAENPQLPLALTDFSSRQPITSYGAPANVKYLNGAQGLPFLNFGPVKNFVPTLGKAEPLETLGHAVQENENFVKAGGDSYNGAEHSSHGEKGDSGYKNLQKYDKGSQGKHDSEGHKGHYAKEGGNRAGHHDVGGYYAQNEAAAKGAKGESFHQSGGHKKGSKTTGFHKVYHKDEYKKDHTFYDESDTNGHFNKFEHQDAKSGAQKGGFEKGGHHKGGYNGGKYGVSGYQDKGKYNDNASGFKGKQGDESYYKDDASYGKKGGNQEGEEHGFAELRGVSAHV